MVRSATLAISSFFVVLCCAQDWSCTVPAERYAILNEDAWKSNLEQLEGVPFQVDRSDVERAECILMEFITWHKGLTRQGRDSLMDVSEGLIRNVCMSKDWSTYHRQYRGYDQAGSRIIRVNLSCHEPSDNGFLKVDLAKVWYEVDDGGDCCFQASVDLTHGEVVRFSVNGPVDPSWCTAPSGP